MDKKQILFIGGIIFALNLIWEFSHYRLYNDLSSITGPIHLIIASLGDVFLIFIILILVSLINKNVDWLKNPKAKNYFIIAVFAIIFAIAIEVVNMYFLYRWSHKASMPTIFGIGLSPLLQLAITGNLGIFLAKKLTS